MIVEFSGLPGSGKSTIYNELNKNISNVTFILNNKFNIINEIYLFIFFLLNIFKTYKYIYLFKIVVKSENSLFDKFNIIRNIIKKISKFLIYKNQKGVFVFDEGISHIVFNLFVDSSSRDINEKEIKKSFNILPLPDMLFMLSADKSLIIDRLKNRGHKRIKFDDNTKVENFINKSFTIQELIKEEFKKNIEVVEIINNNANIAKVIEIISLRLKGINV